MDNKIKKIVDILETKYSNLITSPINFENVDLYTIIQNTDKEHRLYIFKIISKLLDDREYCLGLKYAYTKTEGINLKTAQISLEEVIDLFKIANPKILMEKDYNKFVNLPNELTIYRGTTNKELCPAISWTIDKKRAIWFYQKYDSQGAVFKAKVKKEDVICYFDKTACNEKEVIIDYKKIYNVEELKETEINTPVKFLSTKNSKFGVNTDYVVAATKYLVEQLAKFGIVPDKELVSEIYKTYQENGKYESKYMLTFPSGDSITLCELIKQIE